MLMTERTHNSTGRAGHFEDSIACVCVFVTYVQCFRCVCYRFGGGGDSDRCALDFCVFARILLGLYNSLNWALSVCAEQHNTTQACQTHITRAVWPRRCNGNDAAILCHLLVGLLSGLVEWLWSLMVLSGCGGSRFVCVKSHNVCLFM